MQYITLHSKYPFGKPKCASLERTLISLAGIGEYKHKSKPVDRLVHLRFQSRLHLARELPFPVSLLSGTALGNYCRGETITQVETLTRRPTEFIQAENSR